MKEALVCDRFRPLFIYLLLRRGDTKNTILISNDKFLSNIHYGHFEKVITYSLSNSKIFVFKIFHNKFQQFKLKLKNSNTLKQINITYGQRHILGMGLFGNNNIIVIEDGLQDYLEKGTIKDKIRELIFRLPSKESKRVTMTILTGIRYIPSSIRNPKKISMTKEWEKLKEYQRRKILEFFNVEDDYLNLINGSTLLITQPISEDKLVNEKEKEQIYLKLVENNLDNQVLIKPHPRDNTDYSFIKNGVKILDKNFPLEIPLLLNIMPKKVVTLYSSVALDFEKSGCELEWYGEDFFSKSHFYTILKQ
ncbi:glycosyltransferase family 52 [Bacillus sp. JJ1533]|uniref:glycosyltransferase family 52 n=1 Tax=Bacillus sp. JJ1533 TaxID=3122959 RepID=UPI002FFE748B